MPKLTTRRLIKSAIDVLDELLASPAREAGLGFSITLSFPLERKEKIKNVTPKTYEPVGTDYRRFSENNLESPATDDLEFFKKNGKWSWE